MGVLATNAREIKFYYHSGSRLGKKALGYIHASEKKVSEVDIASARVTGTQWLELAEGLDLSVEELIDDSNPEFVKTYGNKVTPANDHDWLTILENTPSLLKYPVLVNGDTYRRIKKPADAKIYLEQESSGMNSKQPQPGTSR